MRISLKRTIYSGTAAMLTLTLFVCVFTIISIKKLKSDFDGIALQNITAAEIIKKLVTTLHEQIHYKQEFFINKEVQSIVLFKTKSDRFQELLHKLSFERNGLVQNLSTISHLHNKYSVVFDQIANAVENKRMEDTQRLSRTADDIAKTIVSLLEQMNEQLVSERAEIIDKFYKLLNRILFTTSMIALSASLFAIAFAFFFSQLIIRSLNRVKDVTLSIKKGNFDAVPTIEGSNEFADLNVSFKEMALRLKELEAIHLDANPLTKMPGNLAIEKELIIRFKEKKIFSFCLLDIDNFKAYSDKYGYSQGSDVLVWFGNLIRDIVEKYGQPDDFVGHIGGDDFVLISEPLRVRKLCQKIISLFDKSVHTFYNKEDQKKGYIISLDRQNKITQFPLMTISIAIVSNNRSIVTHPKEVAEKIADLKKYAKTFHRSIYVCDDRRA